MHDRQFSNTTSKREAGRLLIDNAAGRRKTVIYYFSGSGNSLTVARDLAAALRAKLIAIPSALVSDCDVADVDMLGFVFPVYHATFGLSGLPHIVERFIHRLYAENAQTIRAHYAFAVCTHCGAPGFTLTNLARLLESYGAVLSLGVDCKMGVPHPPLRKIGHALFRTNLKIDHAKDQREREKLLESWKSTLVRILPLLHARETLPYSSHASTKPFAPVMRYLLRCFYSVQKKAAFARYRFLAGQSSNSFLALTQQADTSFQVTANCNGCGTCAKVCPVGNIILLNGKPTWQHACENCFACFHWCPRNAITGDIVEYEKRGHQSGVKAADFFHSAK